MSAPKLSASYLSFSCEATNWLYCSSNVATFKALCISFLFSGLAFNISSPSWEIVEAVVLPVSLTAFKILSETIVPNLPSSDTKFSTYLLSRSYPELSKNFSDIIWLPVSAVELIASSIFNCSFASATRCFIRSSSSWTHLDINPAKPSPPIEPKEDAIGAIIGPITGINAVAAPAIAPTVDAATRPVLSPAVSSIVCPYPETCLSDINWVAKVAMPEIAAVCLTVIALIAFCLANFSLASFISVTVGADEGTLS